ncbi:hypothetical protein F4811DRAFT_503551, partial [Daldinia bambusicola]
MLAKVKKTIYREDLVVIILILIIIVIVSIMSGLGRYYIELGYIFPHFFYVFFFFFFF